MVNMHDILALTRISVGFLSGGKSQDSQHKGRNKGNSGKEKPITPVTNEMSADICAVI